MKTILTVLIAYGCGIPPIPPIPPIGCMDMKPVCICDDDGDCEWQYICLKDA